MIELIKKNNCLYLFVSFFFLIQFFCVTNAISATWHHADGGSIINVDAIQNEYNRCRASKDEQPPSRGEYETKSEYETKLARYKKERDCSRFLIQRKIYAQFPLTLKYNADAERFTLSGDSLFIRHQASIYEFSSKNFPKNKQFASVGNSLATAIFKHNMQPSECFSFQNQYNQTLNTSIKSLSHKYFKGNSALELSLSASYYRDLYDSWCRFSLSGISLKPKLSVSSDIQQARALKVIENNLVFRIYFEHNLDKYADHNYVFQGISIHDYESGEELVSAE